MSLVLGIPSSLWSFGPTRIRSWLWSFGPTAVGVIPEAVGYPGSGLPSTRGVIPGLTLFARDDSLVGLLEGGAT